MFAGQITHLRPPDVKYVPTPQSVVDAMLRLAQVASADVVYDLGSGDGRIPITAARTYGARGVGIEIDPFVLREAYDNLKRAGVGDRVRIQETRPMSKTKRWRLLEVIERNADAAQVVG